MQRGLGKAIDGWTVPGRACAMGLGLALALGFAGQARAQGEPSPEADSEESAAAAAAASAASEAEMDAADAEAREHFRIGTTFYEAGRFEAAGEEFETAYALSKRPQLLYNVYVAYRDAHDLEKAIEALRAYLDEVPEAPDRINLEARLASMEAALAEQQAAVQAQQAPEDSVAETRVETQRSVVPIVLMAAGGAMVLGSAITGGVTLSRTNELEGDDARTRGDIDSARALAVSTDVLLFTGLATAATGLVLYLTGALDREREVPVAAGCGPDGCGLSFHGRF